MNCDWVNAHLHQILDGDVPDGSRAALEQHLRDCPSCDAMLRAWAQEEALLKTAMPHAPAPEGLAQQVATALDHQHAPTTARRIRLYAGFAAGAAALLLIVLVASYLSGGSRPPRRTTAATLREANGPVWVRTSPEGPWQAAQPGRSLLVGDEVRTGDGGRAAIEHLWGPNLMLDSASRTRFGRRRRPSLEAGRLFARAPKQDAGFAIGTPHGEAAVRGTAFQVDCRAPDAAVVSVVEGVVELRNRAGAVTIHARQQAAASAGAPPTPPLHADLAPAVAWAGVPEAELSFPLDVALRVRPEAPGGLFVEQAAAFAVEFRYGATRYAELTLYCTVADAAGKVVARVREQVCHRSYRYRRRTVAAPTLPPGRYRATFRLGHGAQAVTEAVDFETR